MNGIAHHAAFAALGFALGVATGAAPTSAVSILRWWKRRKPSESLPLKDRSSVKTTFYMREF